jgi:transposase
MRYKRLSTQKANRILRCFCLDVTATAAAELAGVNRKTANSYYNQIRQKILKEALKETPADNGEFEADESYFGARRVRGAAGKTPCSAS